MLNQTAHGDNRSFLHYTRSLPPPGADSPTESNVSRHVACSNTTDVDIFTTKIFKYQVWELLIQLHYYSFTTM